MGIITDHLQYISPLLLGVCNEKYNTDELLLPTFRALACVLTLARFHAHTSETLSLLKDYIKKFGQFAKVNFNPSYQ